MRTCVAVLIVCAFFALAAAGVKTPTPTPTPSPPPPPTNLTRWFLVTDDRVDAPPLNIDRAMPASQQADGQPVTAKPTVIVVTAIAIPSSLQSCYTIAIDLPLLRAFPGGISSQSSHPTTAHFWIWRNTPPYGRFTTAANLAIESWTAPAPAHNATWSPNRELGVYRYVHTLSVPMTAGNTYHLGVFIEQPLYGAGNRVFWIANAPGHFADQTHPFWFADVYASWLPNPLNAVLQQNMTLAPNGTAFYSSPGDSVGPALRSVVTIVALSCTLVNPTQTIVPGVVLDYGRGIALPPPSLISAAPHTGNTIVPPPPLPPTPSALPPPTAIGTVPPTPTTTTPPTPPPTSAASPTNPTGIVIILPASATPVLISALPPPPAGITPTRVTPPPPAPTSTPIAATPPTVIAAATSSSATPPSPPAVIQSPPADTSSWPAWAISTAILGAFLILALVGVGILIFLRRSRRFVFSSGVYNELEQQQVIDLDDSHEEEMEKFTDKEKAESPKVPAKSELVILQDDENEVDKVIV